MRKLLTPKLFNWLALPMLALIGAEIALASSDFNDGPHIFFQQDTNTVEIKWYCAGAVVVQQQAINAIVSPKCGYNKPITISQDLVTASAEKYTATKMAVLSDIHGQYGIFKALLQANGIIDQQLDWQFADGHLVIAGDVLDRGDGVTESLWLLYQLSHQAELAGGKVHLLLGNHETMVMYDDLRYVNKHYLEAAEALDTTYPQLFSEQTVLGRWLRSLPVITQINDMVFLHGGLHLDFLSLNLSITEVNQQYSQSLGLSKQQLRQVPVLDFLYGSLGPLWYRGYFRDKDATTAADLKLLLTNLKINTIVVGHTSMEGVFSHYNGQIFSVDSSIKRGKSGEILLWQHGNFSRGTLTGEQLPVPVWSKKPE
ncbi:metallophosphoesterase [Rheinheimera sp. MMS21-TC3]|uniref:metallophosphoesterase n=1 Tax=Rheinheimera sp. MMS21-TC3 TaxID=3072790 RepID=UPI0028C42A0B|nr:metallophosphoesterase [Rheinheimera sp. MMS21-TC3]WNO59814.1 metallophosphoesterase [Rheinheimera sp. MMS21-TC3]